MMSEAKKNRNTADKRQELLRIGVTTFTERGFYNTSIDTLVSAAKMPKGSFTYYFGSKNGYILAVIEAYGDYFNHKLDRILKDNGRPPLERIRMFMDDAALGMERFEFRRGCLVGNLGQELAALDEDCRQALLATLAGWEHRIQTCLEEAQAAGDLSVDADVANIARSFWYAWEGAVLGAKLEKSRRPLDLVGRTFMAQLHALGRNQDTCC